MPWLWQNPDWPHFRYDPAPLAARENEFAHRAGTLYGALKHVGDDDRQALTIQLMSEEAVKTSRIEGEILDRESVQSSIQRHFGLKPSRKTAPAAEQGVAAMTVDLYETWATPLSHNTLYRWHGLLMAGRRDLTDIGRYRTGEDPMQIVSNRLDTPEIHYEAPPSPAMPAEMEQLIAWINGDGQPQPGKALAAAGLIHLWFECIHPFEDGNGRLGRAISEKALSQAIGRPALIALSQTIEADRKAYYAALHRNSVGEMDVTDWLVWFADTVLAAQEQTQKTVDFLIAKTKFLDRFTGHLNERQEKVIIRMFREGLGGFKGGLSADNYLRITGTSRATATRDLAALVELGALRKKGELRYTRYELNL